MLNSRLALARLAATIVANSSRRALHLTPVASGGGGHDHPHELLNDGPAMAAGREYVAYFLNGEPSYADRYDYPFPAIRFRKMDAEMKALREKEKGDWKNLSLEEKKKLYRYSFRATFAEFDHPTGRWKPLLAGTIGTITLAMVLVCIVRSWAMRNDLWYLSEEAKNKHLELMIGVYSEPVTGVASKWDYEKNVWKA